MNYLAIARQLVKVEEQIIDIYAREHSAKGMPCFIEPPIPEIVELEKYKKILLDNIAMYHNYEQKAKEMHNENIKQ